MIDKKYILDPDHLEDELPTPPRKIIANHTCQYPCNCWKPNDCSHDDNCITCGEPAVVWFNKMWLCQKHHDYEHACLYRGAPDQDKNSVLDK